MARSKSLDSTLWLNEVAKRVNKSSDLYVIYDQAKQATHVAWNEAIDNAIALTGNITLATLKKPVPSSVTEIVTMKRERSNAAIMRNRISDGAVQ